MYARLRLQDDFYIEGSDLICLLQFLALRWETQCSAEALTGAHTPASPWILTTPMQWLKAARTDRTNEAYIQVGGRMLRRNARLYVSDQGPAYKYAESRWPPHYGEVESSVKAFRGNLNLPYRYIAQRIENPTTVFPHDDKENRQLGAEWAQQTWTSAVKTKAVAQTMRKLLSGEKLSLIELGKDYSRMQHMLPVLVGSMFLAESGRNSRALAINLMLLDLTERGAKVVNAPDRLNFVNVLVHPLLAPRNVNREAPLEHKIRTAKSDATTIGDLVYAGGEMPYSPLEGADAASPKFERQPNLEKIPQENHARVIAKSQKIAPFAMNYINDKEVNVIVHWLMTVSPEFRGMLSVEAAHSDLRVDTRDLVWPDSGRPPSWLTGQSIRKIHSLLSRRMESFKLL